MAHERERAASLHDGDATKRKVRCTDARYVQDGLRECGKWIGNVFAGWERPRLRENVTTGILERPRGWL